MVDKPWSQCEDRGSSFLVKPQPNSFDSWFLVSCNTIFLTKGHVNYMYHTKGYIN